MRWSAAGTAAWGADNNTNTVTVPNYASQTTGTVNSNTWVTCSSNAFVVCWGNDPFKINVYAQVSSNKSTVYQVGYFYSDFNDNTRGVSFSFLVPSGWYFRCNFEGNQNTGGSNAITYRIYPLKVV